MNQAISREIFAYFWGTTLCRSGVKQQEFEFSAEIFICLLLVGDFLRNNKSATYLSSGCFGNKATWTENGTLAKK